MGDLEFLKAKSDSGNLVFASGNRTTTGVICSYTPASGKTFYLVGASTFFLFTSAGTPNNLVEVRNNAVVRDHIGFGYLVVGTGVGEGPSEKNATHVKGDRLVGDGIKTYDLNCSAIAGSTVYGNIFGWIE